MKSEKQVSERLKHIFELFERKEHDKSDISDMIIVAVMRELQWVLYDKQEAVITLVEKAKVWACTKCDAIYIEDSSQVVDSGVTKWTLRNLTDFIDSIKKKPVTKSLT